MEKSYKMFHPPEHLQLCELLELLPHFVQSLNSEYAVLQSGLLRPNFEQAQISHINKEEITD
ncbi:hypothetical protein J7J74_00645 [bacterium]|nr:hypothetical protein [bacterium]